MQTQVSEARPGAPGPVARWKVILPSTEACDQREHKREVRPPGWQIPLPPVWQMLEAHDVVAGVDVEGFAGDPGAHVR